MRERMRRRPVAWFFALALAIEVAVVVIAVVTGAFDKLSTAVEAAGLAGRTDFVALGRLVVAEPGMLPDAVLVVLQPFSPDVAAFLVAGLAFGLLGLKRVVRGYRFWSADIGWRRGLRAWGLMTSTFVAMSLATAGLDALFMPEGSWGWPLDIFSLGFPLALLFSVFLDVGGVSEETGWRGFALPVLESRMTPLAATLIIGVMWGIWHLPARPDILAGAYGLGGGVVLLGILVVRFVFLSIVMTYFYNRVGGSTLIAIAMHGLHNDSVGLMGRITGGGYTPYVISELSLLAPIVAVAVAVLFVSGRKLGLLVPSAKW
jgi:membrane protease YdiL (CAAX protease family)